MKKIVIHVKNIGYYNVYIHKLFWHSMQLQVDYKDNTWDNSLNLLHRSKLSYFKYLYSNIK